jgi:hypothetical protein
MIRFQPALVVLVSILCFGNPVENARGEEPLEVVLTAETNHWPRFLWTYVVTPTTLPKAVFSNLLDVASLTIANRTNIVGRGLAKQKDLLFFTDSVRSRFLAILPNAGSIQYKDDSAIAKPKQLAENIPSEQQALDLALIYLRKMGIDRSSLATKQKTPELLIYREEGRHGWTDKVTGNELVEVIRRGVFFVRRIDDVNFEAIGTKGGVCLFFGNNGKLAEASIVWPTLVPEHLVEIFSAEKIVAAIRSQRFKWISPVSINSPIKKIEITGITPQYHGALIGENQSRSEPFAFLTTTIQTAATNVTANLECAIFEAVKR